MSSSASNDKAHSPSDSEYQDVVDTESYEKYPQNLVADDDGNAVLGTTHALRRSTTAGSTVSQLSQDAITRVLSEVSSSRLKKDNSTPLPKMGGGREYPPDLPDRDPWRVDYDGPDDPLFPQNWPLKKKMGTVIVLGWTTMCCAWGSSIFASAALEIAEEFHKGLVTVTLGVALYVFGFASGPIIWAPMSELYGRKLPLVLSMLGFTCFSFGVAVAKDFQTIMLCRFFAGFLGAAPLAVVAAAFADMFNNETRGTAMIIFSGMVFTAPIIAPVVGGFIANSKLHWRWTEYITGIMGAVAFVGVIFYYEETYTPIVLARKAQNLRRRTGNWGIYAPHESVELDIHDIVTKNLARPILLLFREPIIFLITIYTAFIYGILYLCLEAYPIVFGPGGYNFKPNLIQLPYLGLAVGMILAMVVILWIFEPRYQAALARNNNKPVPEARLPPMIAGAFAFPIGIFWFTWTGNYHESVHWAVPTVAGLFIGFGLLSIFLPAINYIIDSYLMFAASALAGNTFLRSMFGGAFPLFATAMFHNLGTNWAGMLIGCIAVVLAPVPILFYIYGKRIRQKSKYAFDLQ